MRPLGHEPVLDGVRGVAWLAVFAGHAGLVKRLGIGQVAMFVWFGLSGFLITSLLVGESSRTGRISLSNFYARRALRLIPALCFFLSVWLAAVVLFGHEPWMTTVPGGGNGVGEPFTVALQGAGAALAYVTNWFDIFNVFGGYVPLGHLWSLAVEEQFYVVWAPLLALMLAVRWRRAALICASLLAACSFADVMFLQHSWGGNDWLFFSTDTRAGAFLVGAALGVAWSKRQGLSKIWARLCTPLIWACLSVMGFAAWLFNLSRPIPAFAYAMNWIALSLAGPVLVVALIDRRRRSGHSFLTGSLVTYVGRRSYALYLWHYVWLTWFRDLGLAGVLAAFVASFASAEISWRLVEARALALKSRFSEKAPGRLPAASGSEAQGYEIERSTLDRATILRGA
ncbi:MAG: acyltransferase family protein [Acidimicrobiales bacterium]